MLTNKRNLYGVILVGVVMVLVALLIDPIRGYVFYLNAGQIVLLIVGIVVAAGGAYLAFVRKPPAG
jgi:hypothetical protein